MPEGGELQVNLIPPSPTDYQVAMPVIDTGSGIEPDIKEKIFDPLFTNKMPGKGTGLGLFVVKQILDDCHGSVEVFSIPQKGTRFQIKIPAAPVGEKTRNT